MSPPFAARNSAGGGGARGASAREEEDGQQLLQGHTTLSDAVGAATVAAFAGGRSSMPGGRLARFLPTARGYSQPEEQTTKLWHSGGTSHQQQQQQQQQDGEQGAWQHGSGSRKDRWCPEDEAGWLSRLLFNFVGSLMAKGQHLQQQDLWDTSRQDEPAVVWGSFKQQLDATATHSAPKGVLWRALCRVHSRQFVVTAAVKVVHDLLMFSQPWILGVLLHHLSSGARDRWIALGLATLMLLASLLEAVTVNIYFQILFRMSLHTKVQLLELLYRKALTISSAVKSAMGVGPIMNLQSNDAAKLWSLPSYVHMIWNGPFQIVVVMSMLVRVLTLWPALAGLGMTVAIIPLTMLLGRLLTAARKESVAAADARVKLTTEVITGIKAIKLMAWEEPYLSRINGLRDTELAAIKKSQLLSMINSSVFNTAPVLVSLAAFGTYAALGHPLTAAVAFPSLALFNLLRFPIVMIPQQIFNLIAARVGITRIQEFLDAAEMTGVERTPAAAAAACVDANTPSHNSSSNGTTTGSTNSSSSSNGSNGLAPAGQQQPSVEMTNQLVGVSGLSSINHQNHHQQQQQHLSLIPEDSKQDALALISSNSRSSSNGSISNKHTAAAAAAAAADIKLTVSPPPPATDSSNHHNSSSSSSPAAAAATATAAVSIHGCSFAWAPDSPPVLHDVSLSLQPGQLVMVVGPVGSGKSSLLAAMLGEMVAVAAGGGGAAGGGRASGGGGCSVSVAGSVAYTAQDPWIQNATVRNNILMGLPFQQQRYSETVQACCLDKDLEMLPAGDLSEIGEKGINLSGGQKARVALARAVYAAADVLLLDDPLSAVDAHVGRALFDGCMCGTLAGRTRVLVTHQLQYLPLADLVLVLLEGRIAHMAPYKHLIRQGVDLSAFVPSKADDEQEGADGQQQQGGGGGVGDGGSGVLSRQQQQQEAVLSRSLLAADSQQLGNRTPELQAAVAAATGAEAGHTNSHHNRQQQQQGGGGEQQQQLQSVDSGVQLVHLPSYYTKSLLASGGSFASHVPVRFDSAQQQQQQQQMQEQQLVVVGVGGDSAALTNAAAATAAAAGGSLAPSAGEAVSLAVDSIEPPPSAFMQQQQDGDYVDGEQEAAPLITAAAGRDSSNSSSGSAAVTRQYWQQPPTNGHGEDAAGSGGSNGGGSSGSSGSNGGGGSNGGSRRKGQLVLAESKAKGQVKRSVYLAYLTAMGPLLAVPIAVLIGAFGERGLQVLQNLVLSLWSNHTSSVQQQHQQQQQQQLQTSPTTNTTDPSGTPSAAPASSSPSYNTAFYLTLYFALGLSSVGVVLVRSALLVLGSISASRRLHSQLLHKLLRLPMTFFDAQPSGRLINRFTKDTEAVDTQLSAAVNSALSCLVSAVLAIVVVVTVSPLTVVVLVPLAVLYYRVQGLYLTTSRELKRLDALAFSPIFQHYGESLSGLPTIRAFQRQRLFEDINRDNIIQSNRAFWPIQLLNRWLSMRLELTGAVVVFAAAVGVCVVAPRNAGLAGLALTSALNLTGTLAWMVRQVTELEVNMNAVERMVEWKSEPEEAPAVVQPRPPPSWPHAGAIEVVQLVVRYRPDLPAVIKGLSFSVKAGEKIGICGRTGCGKSSLMLTLFRIVEPCGGAILIDGLDTATMGLADLRSRLSLVPQDPVVFSGSFRSNLDPFSQAGSDGAIWAALRQAGLDGMVRSMGGLDASIQEGGGNLSGGQRQLLCMARALLRSSRILVLDEATSNVDQAADALLQATLRRAFAQCTVLTIAHRLNTISDADRIMVLDAGFLREFDAPAALMQVPGGVFRGLMEEATRSHATL